MDLDGVERVVRPKHRDDIPAFADGDAYLAGGTWLYSEPQAGLRRVIDLQSLGWPAVVRTPAGLEIAATCTLAEIEAFAWPPEQTAGALALRCCRALWGSFKIREAATVGGNLCLALPASPMAALAVALDGVCTIWAAEGVRAVPVASFITGERRTALRPGEVLRSVLLPEAALRRRHAFRQASLTPQGRSAALLVGARDDALFALTVTASVGRPVRLDFAEPPAPAALAEAIDRAVPAWFDDIHGRPAWRRRITHLMAAEILRELG